MKWRRGISAARKLIRVLDGDTAGISVNGVANVERRNRAARGCLNSIAECYQLCVAGFENKTYRRPSSAGRGGGIVLHFWKSWALTSTLAGESR
jgi:hypothetical protein